MNTTDSETKLADLASRPLPAAAQRAIAAARADLGEHLTAARPIHLDAFEVLWKRKLSARGRRSLIRNATPDSISWLCRHSGTRRAEVVQAVAMSWRLGDLDVTALANRLSDKALPMLIDMPRLGNDAARRLDRERRMYWLDTTTVTVDAEIVIGTLTEDAPVWKRIGDQGLLRHFWYQPEDVRLRIVERLGEDAMFAAARSPWTEAGAEQLVALTEGWEPTTHTASRRRQFLSDMVRYSPVFNPDQRARLVALLPEYWRDVPLPERWGNPADGDQQLFDEFAQWWEPTSEHTTVDDWLLLWLDAPLDHARKARLATMVERTSITSPWSRWCSDYLRERVAGLGIALGDITATQVSSSNTRAYDALRAVPDGFSGRRLDTLTTWDHSYLTAALVERFGNDPTRWEVAVSFIDDADHMTITEFCDTVEALV